MQHPDRNVKPLPGDILGNIPTTSCGKVNVQGPLTAQRLREVVNYDQGTGRFTWTSASVKGQTWEGRIAGYERKDGYRHINIDKHAYYAHRLAWLYVYGFYPAGWLDHINGNPRDNNISNLREVTYSQNRANSRVSSRNTSGVKGVHWNKNYKKWEASIKGVQIDIFDSIEEAAQAYSNAAKMVFGKYARASQ